MAGCAGQAARTEATNGSPIDASIAKGIALLSDGQPKEANNEINRALAHVPSNASLHFLNGLAYQRLAEASGQGYSPLAETGYRLAIEFDPGNWLAARQLGLLQLQQGKYAEARETLAKAAKLRPRDPDIQLALAGSAYLASDIPVALVAAEKTLSLRADDPEALRIAALSSAMLDMDTNARELAGQLSRVRPGEADAIGDKLDAIKEIRAQAAEKHAQADPDPQVAAPPSLPFVPPAASGSVSNDHSPVAAWNDCVSPAAAATTPNWAAQAYNWGNNPNNNWGSSNPAPVDSTERLTALPFPCKGQPLPRMAVIDVTIIRTEEQSDFSQGLNLLDGLKIILTGSWSSNADKGGVSKTITRSIGLGADGVLYSLNIFNATDKTSDVIARPSLLVLDRTPATFFSGYSVTVALQGQYGGSINDKNIGVSLSVTPTFLDDDRILLSVKGARSFLDPTLDTQGIEQAMTTSSNTVFTSAIMKFGETLILSGLREREQTKDKRGVPVLRDVPILQYLFSTRRDTDYSQHVLIVLTPRKPATMSDVSGAASGAAPAAAGGTDAIGRRATEIVRQRRPNFDAIVAGIQAGEYRDELLSGDVSIRRFAPIPSLERVLQDFRQLIYY